GSVALLAAIQLAAMVILLWSESDYEAQAAFILTWGILNFFWLAWLARPLAAEVLSLALVLTLIVLSAFKHTVLMMTATFVDVMLIDRATFSFLMAVVPGLAGKAGIAAATGNALLTSIWRIDRFRVRRTLPSA